MGYDPVKSMVFCIIRTYTSRGYDYHRTIPLTGVRSVYLLDYGDRKIQPLPESYKTFDVAMDSLKVKATDTVYWCKIVQLPDMGAKKQHLFRVDPVIEKRNEPYVHHMLFYQCNGVAQHIVGKQGPCSVRNMPQVDCTDITIYAWAVGAGTFYMPPHSGFSLNTPGKKIR